MPNSQGQVLSNFVVNPNSVVPPIWENSEVMRLCMLHFSSAVWPEFQKFKEHLERQGIEIETRFERRTDQDHLRAQLMIQYPLPSLSVLDFFYDYPNRCLMILGLLGEKASEVCYKFSFSELNEVTNAESYAIIESFVTAVFNELSLCEFVTEEDVEE